MNEPPPAVAMLVASGEQPEWRLFRHGDALWLVERGRPTVRAAGIRQRWTPFEQRMGARMANGGFLTLTWTFGACRPASGMARSAYLATVSFGSRVLSGCYAGIPQGERPTLD